MPWKLNDNRPIYIQIMEEIKLRIITGVYAPGSKVPSVRDLANDASVNPNTMQRALTELERDGLIATQRTSGRTVTTDTAMLKNLREQIANEEISSFLIRMKKLSYNEEESFQLLTSYLKNKRMEL